MLRGHLYDPFRTALLPTIIVRDNLRKLIFLQSCCSIWSDLAWEKILGSVDSQLETARAGVVVGRDGSNRGSTRSGMLFLNSVRISNARSRPRIPKKLPRANSAFLELNDEFEIVLRYVSNY